MNQPPDTREQILTAHAGLIHRVVVAAQNRGAVPDLDEILRQAEENDWKVLVAAIRRILSGEREMQRMGPLDAEDRTIVESILLGIQNPATLPDLSANIDANMAAPGIAALVHASRTGNIEALETIANMANQMMQAGGDMARVAACVRPLVTGERDADRLCDGLGDEAQKLMLSILSELGKLEAR